LLQMNRKYFTLKNCQPSWVEAQYSLRSNVRCLSGNLIERGRLRRAPEHSQEEAAPSGRPSSGRGGEVEAVAEEAEGQGRQDGEEEAGKVEVETFREKLIVFEWEELGNDWQIFIIDENNTLL